MAHPTACPSLSLPQELRDGIYEFALNTADGHVQDLRELPSASTCRSAGWTLHLGDRAPTATFLSLMLCCRQLRVEVGQFLRQCQGQAKLQIHASYPDMKTEWSFIQTPPEQLTELDISLKIGNLFDPRLDYLEYEDVLFRPVFDILKRFIHSGPHLARTRPLSQPLELRTVRITIASATPVNEMTYVFASPAATLYMMFGRFNALLGRLARSGLLVGVIGAFEAKMEGDEEEWERTAVSSDVWDEEDHVFIKDLGFRWGPVEAGM